MNNTKSRIYNYTDQEFIDIVFNATSISDACKKLGVSIGGKNGRGQIKKRCDELLILKENRFTGKQTSEYRVRQSYNEILVENSTYHCTSRLKRHLVEDHLLEYKCAFCGNTGQWMNKPLVLQLDHINGNNTDNRLDNLRLVCPNCHSQTETFSGKGKALKNK